MEKETLKYFNEGAQIARASKDIMSKTDKIIMFTGYSISYR
jgi:hypothetical protein